VESQLPRFLVAEQVFSTPLWRWIAFLLLIPVAVGLSSATVSLLKGGLRIWMRRRPSPVLQDLHDSVGAPAKLILTVVYHRIGIGSLGLPLLFRDYYGRFVGIVLAGGLAWLVVRLINHWAERARVSALAGSGYRSGSIVLLGQRVLNVVVVIAAALTIFSILGFNTTTAVAGLGIGSLAVAFAAQKTLENLLGGISILGDQVIRVGETCRIGDKVGSVEDISLRSTRIRTLESTELSVPNGQLANMSIENLSRYDRNSFRETIGLQHETSSDQMRSVLEKIRALLSHHPKVDPEVARVRLIGFGESSLDVQIHCHILTGNFNEFLAIREELLLRIMDLVADAGTALALPSRTLYMAQDQDLDRQRLPAVGQNASERPFAAGRKRMA
jgi:MscS family membrane protein